MLPSQEPEFQRHIEALYQEAVALRAAGRSSEAEGVELKAAGFLEDLEALVRERPEAPETPAVLLFLAERAWAVLGDHPDVLRRLEQALALSENPRDPGATAQADVLTALAEFHFLAGRYGQAEPLYRRALSLYGQTGDARPAPRAKCAQGLAQTLAILGRPAEADPFFETSITHHERPQGDKRTLYFLYIYRAEGLEKLSRISEADTLRKKAVGLLPKNNPGETGFHV